MVSGSRGLQTLPSAAAEEEAACGLSVTQSLAIFTKMYMRWGGGLGGARLGKKTGNPEGSPSAGRCKVLGDLGWGICLMWLGKHICMEHVGWGGIGLGARANESTVRV